MAIWDLFKPYEYQPPRKRVRPHRIYIAGVLTGLIPWALTALGWWLSAH